MITIETLIHCDGCGDNWSGDDRSFTAAEIRASRSEMGWVNIGKFDYCPECVGKGKHRSKPSATWTCSL